MSSKNKPEAFGGVEKKIKNLAEGAPPAFDPSILEPSVEKVTLPSKGMFYGATENDNMVLKENRGEISIRPMTFKEESMLSNPRIIKSGGLLDSLLLSTIRTNGVNVEALLSYDRMFLFYYLRSISYGDKYVFNTKCPSCNKSIKHTVALSSLDIKYASENDKEPITVHLNNADRDISFRFSRGFDEKSTGKEEDETDETILSIVKLIVTIGDVPKMYWKKFIENLSVNDSSQLRRAIAENEAGLQTITSMKCPYCNEVFKEGLPLTAGFFQSTPEA